MIKIVGDIIGSDSLAVIKKLYKDTWSVSGNIGGMDSGARIKKIEDNKWQLKGSIGGYESVGIFQKIQEDTWSLKGDIGGFISRAEIKKTSRGKWQLKGSIGGFNSVAEILIPEQTEQKTKRDYESKISPHFDFSHPDNKSNARQEAVIIYQGQEPDRFRKSGRLYERSEHLDILQNRAEFHQRVENRIFERYLRNCGKGLNVSSIGNSILPVAKAQVTRESLLELSEISEVLAVIPNHELHLIEPVNMPDLPVSLIEKNDKMTWGLQTLEIPTLWEKTKGKGVITAVLDTGVYGDHPALRNKVKSFILIDHKGRRITAEPSFDASSHGTHVCGTIAGGKDNQDISIGTAPESSLIVAGVLLNSASLTSIIEGLTWAVEKQAGIINMSLGFPWYEPQYELILNDLIENHDILPVVSIGNFGHGNTGSPGNIASAFSVGAFQKGAENVDFVAPFSGGGSLVFPGHPNHEIITKPDVAAPGVGIYSCIPPLKDSSEEQYAYQSGTSMAAPHVSGVAALLMSAYPGARASEIMEVLKQTAVHPDGNKKRPDNRWGYGMINPAAACKALSGV